MVYAHIETIKINESCRKLSYFWYRKSLKKLPFATIPSWLGGSDPHENSTNLPPNHQPHSLPFPPRRAANSDGKTNSSHSESGGNSPREAPRKRSSNASSDASSQSRGKQLTPRRCGQNRNGEKGVALHTHQDPRGITHPPSQPTNYKGWLVHLKMGGPGWQRKCIDHQVFWEKPFIGEMVG